MPSSCITYLPWYVRTGAICCTFGCHHSMPLPQNGFFLFILHTTATLHYLCATYLLRPFSVPLHAAIALLNCCFLHAFCLCTSVCPWIPSACGWLCSVVLTFLGCCLDLFPPPAHAHTPTLPRTPAHPATWFVRCWFSGAFLR